MVEFKPENIGEALGQQRDLGKTEAKKIIRDLEEKRAKAEVAEIIKQEVNRQKAEKADRAIAIEPISDAAAAWAKLEQTRLKGFNEKTLLELIQTLEDGIKLREKAADAQSKKELADFQMAHEAAVKALREKNAGEKMKKEEKIADKFFVN